MPFGRVDTATGSYADQASYIAVCTIASAREVMVGPGMLARTAASAALFHCRTTLSLLVFANADQSASANVPPPAATAASPALVRRIVRRLTRRPDPVGPVQPLIVASSMAPQMETMADIHNGRRW